MEDRAEPSRMDLPRSLPAWLPFLWSRVLFPGGVRRDIEPCRLSSLFLLLVLPAALLYPSLSFHLFEPDESRYAEIGREMLQRGEWVVPYLQSEPYLDKPPLLYWLIEASYAVFGVHVWAARLVPALAVQVCVLLVYVLGRRSVGERAAFWGALALSLAPGWMSMGWLLLMDGVLTLWTTLALLSAFEAVRGDRLRWGWWTLASVACGLGVLTKGPVALLLLLPPLCLQCWLTGSGCRPGRTGAALFAIVLLIVTLPWYAAISLRIPTFRAISFGNTTSAAFWRRSRMYMASGSTFPSCSAVCCRVRCYSCQCSVFCSAVIPLAPDAAQWN